MQQLTASTLVSERGLLLERMLFIRILEEKLQKLCDEGKGSDLHFSRGQEAISVGVCSVLRETDYIAVHHRTIAHAVAKGVPMRPLLAEILGKAEGINGGRAGEMHLSYLPKRFMFSFQLVGTCVPVAAGIAWAVKNHLKTDDIVAVFHGDAATANGQFHEGLNIAAVQGLPLLLVCENNHVAGNVREKDYLPVSGIVHRASAYGVDNMRVDGNDINAVVKAAIEAVGYVRARCRPFLLECDTTRLGKHKQGQGDRRSKEEMERLWERDPLRNVLFDPIVRQAMEAEIDEVIQEVQAGPDPVLSKE